MSEFAVFCFLYLIDVQGHEKEVLGFLLGTGESNSSLFI